MLRYRAAEAKVGKSDFTQRQLAQMDRNGRLAAIASPIVNWASAKDNGLTRPLMEKTVGIDRDAVLPQFHTRTFMAADRGDPIAANEAAPAFGKRKAALFATCFVNYNKPFHRHGRAGGAEPYRCRNPRRLSRLLRDAVPRTGRRSKKSPDRQPKSRRNWSN